MPHALPSPQDIMDENLPDAIHFMGIYGLILISTTITVSVTINFFGAFTGALIFMTLLMLAIYLPAATALKKARNVSGGMLVGLVAEVLEGLNVVQAFNKQDYFISDAARRCDHTNSAVFNAEALNLWLAFWCDLIGACLVGVVSAFAVALKGERTTRATPALMLVPKCDCGQAVDSFRCPGRSHSPRN
jgi:ABC-type multidrug transport system fused ATPase/permease subunit